MSIKNNNKSSKKTVFVGMSGGVDSSVAAYLLKEQGYSVVGVFMRCWGGGPSTPFDSTQGGPLGVDCAERDAEDARRVAEHLGIPFYVWDFEEEYKRRVVQYMVDGYRNGITPNPDVMCNKEIKFGLFLDKALAAGADFVATGHYVRLASANSESGSNKQIKRFANSQDIRYSLMVARDPAKDQSYFLWTLTQDQLRHCLFPIGDYLKPDVRAIARTAGLPTADKKDSQGICFLGQVSIADFLKQYIAEKPGALVTTDGREVGEHLGAEFYTIGQRHLGILGGKAVAGRQSGGAKKPFYVAEKDLKNNTIVVAEGSENPALYRKEINLTDIHFIDPLLSNSRELESGGLRVLARVRYRQPLAEAVLKCDKDKGTGIKGKKSRSDLPGSPRLRSGGAGCWSLVFKTPQKFVAPGQSAVLYQEPGGARRARAAGARDKGQGVIEMLGGGVIV